MDLLSLVLLLILDTSASWLRMFVALFISVVISVFVGVWAATSNRAERIVLPVVDVLQTVPILAFFPFAIYVFVFILPGFIGINAAVIFLIITSMLWNIIFGVYESVKTIPKEFTELADLYHYDFWSRLRRIYVPASMPRIVEQSILSWAIGLFYLVTSEIFSTGNANYHVGYGIGSVLPSLTGYSYLLAVAIFVCFVVATRFLFFRPLERYSTRYLRGETKGKTFFPKYEKQVLDWIGERIPRARAVFDTEGFSVSPIKKATSSPGTAKKSIDYSKVYTFIGVAILLVFAYEVLSNAALLGYELQVLPALAFSFARVWLAFALVIIVSVPLCVYLVFMSKRTSQYLLLFQVMASIPATILLPLIVTAINPSHSAGAAGESVAFIIFFLSGIWYVIFGVIASTRTLPSNIFEVKKMFGVDGMNAWKNIYLKAIIPGLITGSITAIAAEWNASIVAEYFTSAGISGTQVLSGVGTGIGKLLDLAISQTGGLGLMAIALFNLVVMIILINTFVWKRYYKKIARVYS